MKKTEMMLAALCVALAWTGVLAERIPAAYLDSSTHPIDTRIGAVCASENQTLDSRTGSRADSNLRGLNTTKMGASFIIR